MSEAVMCLWIGQWRAFCGRRLLRAGRSL